MLNRFFRACLVVAACAAMPLAAATPLIANGDFETDADGDARPDGWPMPTGASWETEAGNHFLRLHAAQAGVSVNVFRQVELGNTKAIRCSFRYRHSEVKRGSEGWHDARFIVDFKDSDGKVVKSTVRHPFFVGSSAGWQEKVLTVAVPERAVTVSVMPALFQVASGTLDVDDITVVAIDPADLAR